MAASSGTNWRRLTLTARVEDVEQLRLAPGSLDGVFARRALVPMVRFARPGSAFWEWPKRFFFGYVPQLVECGLLTTAELAAFETEWRNREQNPAAFLSTPPMVGVIAEKQ